MNINQKIETAFKDFGVTIAFLQYTGDAETYLTYYTWLEKPNLFFDDNYNTEVTYGTIDIFSKENFKDILTQVKKILKQNNFIWTDTAPETYDPDTGFFHVPVNFVQGE